MLQLLSSIAFSQPATPADSGLWLPHWRARAVALDLLELDSLRHERPLLIRRIELLELYRQQAAQRSTADSQLVATQALQLHLAARQLQAGQTINGYYRGQAAKYKRQRNVVIAAAAVVTVTTTTLLIKSIHPP